MKVVKDPGKVTRTYSVWGMTAGLMILAQDMVPLWEGVVPDHTFQILGSAAVTLGLIGRFIKQNLD
jgi:hypothetical protein